jgi:hypothetical protein
MANMRTRSLIAGVFSAGLLLTGPVAAQYRPKLPDPIPVPGFKQLLPHGGIPALVNPDFVAADKARIPASSCSNRRQSPTGRS